VLTLADGTTHTKDAVVGSFLGTLLGFGDVSGFDVRSMALAVAGGIVVLFLYGFLTRTRG
jgi:uncharacterized membrane protein YeaQ/YmgE (transglycosylase-associated protein family)